MARAMDRTRKPPGRRARFAMIVATASVSPLVGCAYLKGYRGVASPKAGVVDRGDVDPYLVHHRIGPPASPPDGGAALASVEPEGATGFVRTTDRRTPDGTPGGIVPTEVVSLGTPVALPTANNPHPAPTPPPAVVELHGPEERPKDDAGSVVVRARAAISAMTTYQVQINRQERVGGSLQPAEDVQLSVRRSPKAVRLEWLDGPHKGREVIYSASESGGMLHVHMGDSLVPVPTLSLPPDSPLVMKNSRHPITEAGLDGIVATLERGVSGPPDGSTTSYGGVETPAALGRPCHKIERHNAAGETWLTYLDARTALPAMVQGTSASGELLERYLFRDVKPDVAELASVDAFDPAKRWSGPAVPGLLGRLARSPGDAKTTATAAPR